MDIDFINLDDLQLDILKEIGNIGSGNAATALSKIMNKRIGMDVPDVKLIPFRDIENSIGGSENVVVGIYLEFQGDITGTILFILNYSSAKALAHILLSRFEHEDQLYYFNDIEMSALQEVGNILASSYLGALSSLTKLRLKPSVPDITVDMAGAIVSVPLIEFGQIGDHAMVIETHFIDGSEHVQGNFFLVPSIHSFNTLMQSLGAK